MVFILLFLMKSALKKGSVVNASPSWFNNICPKPFEVKWIKTKNRIKFFKGYSVRFERRVFHPSRPSKIFGSSEICIRSCFMVSLYLMVTLWSFLVSWSTVIQIGVPMASCLLYRFPIESFKSIWKFKPNSFKNCRRKVCERCCCNKI